jgi:hypothetical protein
MHCTDVLSLLALDFSKLSEVFPGTTSDARVEELKAWLVEKRIQDFEAVPLNYNKVGKVRSRISLVPVQVFDV